MELYLVLSSPTPFCRCSRPASEGSATIPFLSFVDARWHKTGQAPLAQTMSIRWWHSRRGLIRNGISTPTLACQPASLSTTTTCPPLPLAECHARPLQASREAYASCLAPVHTLNPSLSLYLRTSVPNTANDDVAAHLPYPFLTLERELSFSLLEQLLVHSVPAFVLPGRPCICLLPRRTAYTHTHSTLATLINFSIALARASEVDSLVIESAHGRPQPLQAQAAFRSAANRTVNPHSIRAIGN